MGDVIRKGIIEIETRQKKAKLEAPDVGPAVRAHEQLSRAAQKENSALDRAIASRRGYAEAARSVAHESRVHLDRATRSTESFSLHSVRSFERAGSGALTFGRGLALLAASGEDDMKRLAQSMVLVEGGVATLKGGVAVARSLSAAFGPVGLAAAGATLAITAGAVALNHWSAAAEKAVKRAAEMRTKYLEAARANAAVSRASGSRIEDLRVGFAETDAARRQALTGAMGTSRAEVARLQSRTEITDTRRKMIRLPDGTEMTPEEFSARGPQLPGVKDALSGAGALAGRARMPERPTVVDRLDPDAAGRQLSNLKDLEREQERQLELQKRLNDADDEQLRNKQEQGQKFLDLFGLGLPEQQLRQQREALDKQQQQNTDRLLNAAQQTADRIRKLEQDINSANIK